MQEKYIEWITRICPSDFSAELAVVRWEFRDVKELCVLNSVSQFLPPFSHETVAVFEEILKITGLAFLAAQGDHFHHTGGSVLRFLRHSNRVHLDEFHHLSSYILVSDNRPSNKNRRTTYTTSVI